MKKFWVIAIAADASIRRLWVGDSDVAELIDSKQAITIYRTGTDQQAVVLEKEVVWKDVQEGEFE